MKTFAHAAIHRSANSNAGDSALVAQTKRVFEARFGPINWLDIQLWDSFDRNTLELVNRTCEMLVLGGGGLFLKDQLGAEKSISGWQWNISPEALAEIAPPLAVFAVGYNRFRGQEEFDSCFSQSLAALVKQSCLVGIRNTGSIRALQGYLAATESAKLRLQPCPTLLTSSLDPSLSPAELMPHPGQVLFINAAFDRVQMRMGNDRRKLEDAFCLVAQWAESEHWKVVVVAHKNQDLEISQPLSERGLNFQTVNLTDADPRTVLQTYRTANLVVGMRGHAQMIPFGLGIPIVSLITHDKMKWFLEDWGNLDWGVDISEEPLGEILVSRVRALSENMRQTQETIRHRLNVIEAMTRSNLDIISKCLTP